MPIFFDADAFRNNHIPGRHLTLQALRNNGDHYAINRNTKYHVGDTFNHPAGITAIIDDIMDSQGTVEYSLKFLETSTKRELITSLKCAWYTDHDLDNFVQTIDREFDLTY
jgi:hypothetical protein